MELFTPLVEDDSYICPQLHAIMMELLIKVQTYEALEAAQGSN
jgi:hypothetical protein